MKRFIRALGGIAAICATLLLISFTFAVIKKVWLPHKESTKGHVAVVNLSGMILSSTGFTHDLKDALDNKGTKVIVVRINSPGGLVAPSQEIFGAIREADKKVPVLISMGPTAASGGFYAAMGGRKIYANSGTLTASIGVIMEFVNAEKLYAWAKIERYVLKSGKFKDMGNEFRAMTPGERDLLTDMIMDIYQQFRETVKSRRKLSESEIAAVADGRVMTGHQAKNSRLVDELGTFDDVLRDARKMAGLSDSAPVNYPKREGGLLKKLLIGDDEPDGSGSSLNRWIELLHAAVAKEPLSPACRVLMLAPVE